MGRYPVNLKAKNTNWRPIYDALGCKRMTFGRLKKKLKRIYRSPETAEQTHDIVKDLEQRLDQLAGDLGHRLDDLAGNERRIRRSAIVSIVTDNFIDFGKVFLSSLVQSKSIPKGTDVVFLYCPVYAPLSQENMDALQAIYPKLKFTLVDTSFLNGDLIKRWKNGVVVKEEVDARLPEKRSVFLKLAVLELAQYDAVLWLDSDMIILRSVAGLFRTPADIAVVPARASNHAFGFNFSKKDKHDFNSGVMLINRKFLGFACFDEAVELLNQREDTLYQDQSIFNTLWRNQFKFWLPHVYNWKVPVEADAQMHDQIAANGRVVHFVGPSKKQIKRTSPLALHRIYYELLDGVEQPEASQGVLTANYANQM